MKSEIPEFYIIAAERLYKFSNYGKITTEKARWVLGTAFRIPKEKRFTILREMHEWDLIRCSGSKWLEVKFRPD